VSVSGGFFALFTVVEIGTHFAFVSGSFDGVSVASVALHSEVLVEIFFHLLEIFFFHVLFHESFEGVHHFLPLFFLVLVLTAPHFFPLFFLALVVATPHFFPLCFLVFVKTATPHFFPLFFLVLGSLIFFLGFFVGLGFFVRGA
jgi:hypothetical protein